MGIATASGVTEAERQTGIPKETIQYWTRKPEFAHLRTTAREMVVDQFWVGLQVGLEAVVAGLKDPEVPLRDKQQTVAMLYDRHALMTGGATSRSESRDITGTLADSDIVTAIREAERLTTAGGTTETSEGEAAG